MNSVNQIQIQRFKRLFPELPSELAGVVLLYAAGATQADIVGMVIPPKIRGAHK